MTTRLHRLLAGPWPTTTHSPTRTDIAELVAAAEQRHLSRRSAAVGS